MNRLTRKVDNGYGTVSNSDIFMIADMTKKLGKLEDVFELIEEMYKKPVYWKADDGEEYSDYYTHSTILYNPKTNEIEIYEYEFIASYKVEEYGITWWIKEDKELIR